MYLQQCEMQLEERESKENNFKKRKKSRMFHYISYIIHGDVQFATIGHKVNKELPNIQRDKEN